VKAGVKELVLIKLKTRPATKHLKELAKETTNESKPLAKARVDGRSEKVCIEVDRAERL
jgi:hypothetical protein